MKRAPVYTLGINGGRRVPSEDALPGWADHDAAAVLLKDGNIIAAIEEERLNRIKHSNHFPREAINACLELGSITPLDIDIVAVNAAGPPSQTDWAETQRVLYSALFQKYVGDLGNSKLQFVNHQTAHLFSAWVPSGFEECLCLSLDGIGDNAAGAVGIARDGDIQILRMVRVDQSLGEMYCECIKILGYSRFDEYKVMALAAKGSPQTFDCLFSQFYTLNQQGDYTVAPSSVRRAAIIESGVNYRKSKNQALLQEHYDFAAGLQTMLSRIVRHVLGHFRHFTGIANLAAAGGVMHNSAVNGDILNSGMFDKVFIQPAAHDAGGALGAAYAAYIRCQRISSLKPHFGIPSFHVFQGRPLSDDAVISNVIQNWSSFVATELVSNPIEMTARALNDGKIVGWVQGRSEFGPRALGNRSILGDPRKMWVRERINREIKQREPFRPFAPAILTEEVWSVFERPATTTDLDHMTFLLKMRSEERGRYPAVVHSDGTARVQTVDRGKNPLFHSLISHFRELNGTPLLLNTSFNGRGEPIVDGIEDAITCFLLNGLDLLVVGGVIVRPLAGTIEESLLSTLYLRLPPSTKIVRREIPGNIQRRRAYFLETTISSYFGGGSFHLSDEVAKVLIQADGATSIANLCQLHSMGPEMICDSMLTLWRHGYIQLRAQIER